MRVFVLGCGSIGRRHIANLVALGVSDILAFDPSHERLSDIVARHRVRACQTEAEGLSARPDVVLVCSPPHVHVRQARAAVAAGSHVFVEKPLGHALDDVDCLLSEAAHAHRVLAVGYNLRFHQGLLCLKRIIDEGAIGHIICVRAEFGQYLPDWRPKDDYRSTYTARSAEGGGIILDASHELDYVRWIGGEVRTVSCTAARLSDLDIDVEDTAEITLHLEGGILAHVHVDCVQRGYTRRCTVAGTDGTLVWDYQYGMRQFEGATGQWREWPIVTDTNQMYFDELAQFLKSARGEAAPMVDGLTGRRVLQIALAAKHAAKLGREVEI